MDVYFCGSDIFNLLPTNDETSGYDDDKNDDFKQQIDDNDIRAMGKLLNSPVKCNFKESIGAGDVILTKHNLVLLDRKESLLKIFGRDDGVEILYLPNSLSSDKVRISSFYNNLLVIGDSSSSQENYLVSLDETSLGMGQIEKFECGQCTSISLFSFGEKFGLLVDTAGCLFKISPDKNDDETPFLVSPIEKPADLQIASVACGNEHGVVLMKNGDVYTIGGGSRGQLGLGTTSSEERLCLVENLQPLKIVKVTAGGWHSLVLADTGDLYGWGWNESGQLGVASDKGAPNPPQMVSLPMLVETPLESTFVSMATGCRHSAAVSSTGILYTWGCCNYGQLGQGNQKNLHIPKKVALLCKVDSVECTKNGTFIYCKREDVGKGISNGDYG